jgi:predicted nucleic-acid-binding protein
MTGLDTNILVRYIARDDPKQTAAATELIEKRCTAEDPGWINLIVVCELTWVLQRAYDLPKESVACVLETLLTSNELKVESADAVWQALRKFRKGTADLTDYLIGTTNALREAAPTFTFDKRAADDPNFHLLAT